MDNGHAAVDLPEGLQQFRFINDGYHTLSSTTIVLNQYEP